MERNNQFLKKLDFWVGIPLLYCASIFKNRGAKKPQQVKAIGIFAFAAIGDSILSSSLFPALRVQYPQAKITIFASPTNAVVYPILLGYDDLVVLPITKPLAALKILSAYSLDVLIDTSQWTKLSAIYGLFVKAKFKIGFKTSGQYRHIGYDKLINHSNSVHELNNFENLLKPLGINQRGDIAFDFPEINNQSLHNIGIEELKPYVVFHPWASGTRSELREWPIESWAELAKIVLADNFYIIITGSLQNQAEAIELAKMIGEEKKVKVVAGKISFAEAARVIKSAHAVVSVNTGIAHLADQLQVPAIALNGPTNSSRWGLVNSSSINLDVPKKNGGGFLNLGFEYPKNSHYLMNQISVQAVNSALKQLSVKTRAI